MSDDLVERCEGFSELYAILKDDPAACDVSEILREAASTVTRLQGERDEARSIIDAFSASADPNCAYCAGSGVFYSNVGPACACTLNAQATAELTRLRAEVETVLAGGREDRETIDALEGRLGELEASSELLPYAVKVGPGTFGKGVKLATFVDAAQRWYAMAARTSKIETCLGDLVSVLPLFLHITERHTDAWRAVYAALRRASAALAETKPVERAKLGVGE